MKPDTDAKYRKFDINSVRTILYVHTMDHGKLSLVLKFKAKKANTTWKKGKI